jgi:hypothetical protein
MDTFELATGDKRPGTRQAPINFGSDTPPNANNSPLYRPLDEDEIRILEILPGGEEEKVEARFECIKLGPLTSYYNALSYVWGDPKQPKVPLVVNGHMLQVTENCILALKELRRDFMAESKTCYIWIDAICINQTDITERNQQLLNITLIYRRSRKLIIWLGPESDRSHEAIEIMKALPSDCEKLGPERSCEGCRMSPASFQRWLTISTIFSRSWFSRVWIVQEYLACSQTRRISKMTEETYQDIEFYCGTSRVSLSVLAKVFNHRGFYDLTISDWRSSCDEEMQLQLHSIYVAFRNGLYCFGDILERATAPLSLLSSEKTAHQFLGCIVRGLNYGATEPRDRIYAHLPLQLTWKGNREELIQDAYGSLWRNFIVHGQPICNPILLLGENMRQDNLNFSKLIIDYNRSVEDVYSSLVCFMLFSTRSLNILSLCYRRSSHVRRTWTLDLTIASFDETGIPQAIGLLAGSIMDPSRFKAYSASNGAPAEAHFSSDLSVLAVKGYRVAAIAMPYGYPEVSGPDLQLALLNRICLKTFLSFMVDRMAYETLQVAQKTLWQTILAGSGFKNEPEDFQKWCSWLDTDSERLEIWQDIICRQLTRRFFSISGGRFKFGKAWDSIKPEDHICVILGCDVPLVLRPVEDHYELIGDCYVDGIMAGEATKDSQERNVELETFKLC